MKRYIKVSKNDLPYWYGEKANSGFLASVAWRMGSVAIEEYCVDRKYGRKKVEGRCDLWIRFKKREEIIDFSAEAKQLWPQMTKNLKRDINNSLRYTAKQLTAMSKRNRGKEAVSLCFASPIITKFRLFDREDFINSIMKNFGSEKDIFIAGYFPSLNNREILWDNYKYPGVAIIGRYENI